METIQYVHTSGSIHTCISVTPCVFVEEQDFHVVTSKHIAFDKGCWSGDISGEFVLVMRKIHVNR